MSDVLILIAPSGFREEEYAEPKTVLESRGARVVTASLAAGPCRGNAGTRVMADVALRDAAPRDWDAVVLVGGPGASVYYDHLDAHQLARRTLQAQGVVAAICVAPTILARAGLLRGVSATAFASQADALRRFGAVWSSGPVCVSGRIVTASGPEVARAFANEIGDLLRLPKERTASRWPTAAH